MKRLMLLAIAIIAGASSHSHAILIGSDFDGNLYNVSSTDASLTLIGDTGVGLLAALEFAPDGTLYGFTASDSKLYSINPTNADATLIGAMSDFVFEGGLAISSNTSAFGTNQDSAVNPILFSLDLTDGSTTPIGVMSGAPRDVNGLALRSDGMLVGLDRESNALLEINPATAVTSVIATLTPQVGSPGGMATLNGQTGWFATNTQLWNVDLTTGAHTPVGSFGIFNFSGLAVVPEPTTFVLVGLGLAALGVSRRRAR